MPRKAPKRRAPVDIEEERAPVRVRYALAEIEEEPVEPTEEELALERLLAQAPVPSRHVAAIPRLSGVDEARLARLARDAETARAARETREEEARLAQVAREKEEARVAREKEEARVARVAQETREKEEARVAQEKREQQEKQDKNDTQKDSMEMLKKMVETTTGAITAMTNAMNAARPRTGWRFPNFYELVLIGILLTFLFAAACVLPWVFTIYQWLQYLWAPMVDSRTGQACAACPVCPALPDLKTTCAGRADNYDVETEQITLQVEQMAAGFKTQADNAKASCNARIADHEKKAKAGCDTRIADHKNNAKAACDTRIADHEKKAKAACDTRIANYATKRAQDLALKHAREMQDLAAKHEAKCDDRVAREIAALEAELDQVKASAVELDPIETSAVELDSVDTSTVDPLAENEFPFFLVDE